MSSALFRYLTYVFYVLLLAHIKSADSALKDDEIKSIKAGVLVYKGKQTSCALAAIDSKAAVVAASCLGKQNKDTAADGYEVYFDDGIDGKAAKYSVESITIHPEYDSTTLVNNIAVLQYNSNSTNIEWQNKIIVTSPDSFISVYLFYYVVKDLKSMTWASPSYYFNGVTVSESCKTMSLLYKDNSAVMYCSIQLFSSPNSSLSECSVPYNILYTVDDDNTSIAGLYSFSAISGGNNFCSYVQQRSYYTIVGVYAEYIKKIINRDILMTIDSSYTQINFEYSKDPGFSMNKTSRATSPQGSMMSGDLYINQTIDDASSTDSVSNEPESNDAASQDTYATNSVDSSSQNGSYSKAGIIAGACIGAAGLIIISGAIYYIRWKRKKSPGVADPMRNNDFQNMLEASRPGRTTVGDYDIHTIADYDLPPVYEEAKGHRIVSQYPSSDNRTPDQ